MKNDPVTGALVGVLALSALLSVVICYIYVSSSRQLRSLQGQTFLINSRRAAIGALVTHVMEYSKTHPAIDPVLESAGLKSARAGAGAPAATPAKPATK